MTLAEILEYLKNTGPASILTFMLGFFVSRLTMTKKEKKDFEQTLFENGKDLMDKQNERFVEFTAVIKKYIGKDADPSIDDFYEIATSGEKYFYQQKIISDAILTGKVDGFCRDNTLVPSIRETINKSLPCFYNTLRQIAEKKGFLYHGKLERRNYESLYLVLEKFGKSENNS